VNDGDLASLPEPARRLMRFAGVIGRPRDWSFRARWETRFRLAPDKPWMASEVWQYNTNLDIARIFHMRMRLRGIVPIHVRDLYVRGAGHMVGRIVDSFSIVDNDSEKVTIGELVTYLNDALLFAPSMLLGPGTTWLPVDGQSFDVSLTDRGRTVVGRVLVDARGALTDFATTDRFGEEPAHREAGLVQARWTTPVASWAVVSGRPRPVSMRAIWHFSTGDFCYAEASTTAMHIAYNVPPHE
jgi:hypothetical protein